MTKITTWNVNSIRARLEHTLTWLEQEEPTLLCLQETKVQNEEFPLDAFKEAGWHATINGQKAYNGVAFLSRTPLEATRIEAGIPILDEQKRFISTTINGVHVYNLYVPNGKEPKSPSFKFKEEWYAAFRQYLVDNHTADDKILVCGDFNVAPGDLDVTSPEKRQEHCCFHPDVKKWFNHLLDWGLTDTFRHLYPEEQAFTWWDYRLGSFQRNKGMRIDHHLASHGLMPLVKDVTLFRDERKKERPSDHIPVTITLDV